MKTIIEELKWRGLFHQSTAEIEDLNINDVVAYAGFDPTADSLHIGNLAPIMLMMHIKRAGGSVIGLVGGATGMIGDPSGKKSERNFLDEETLNKNFEGVKAQLENIFEFDPNFNLINNFDTFNNMSVLDLLRDFGKHLTVNVMMSKDSVKSRINRTNNDISNETSGISFTEFTYQLIQGIDFHNLFVNNKCNLQIGGSDQWGNITAGTELIRRKHSQKAHGLTCPLISKSDGSKFGKSEKGNVWLSPEKTTPFEFFQFWINQSDEDAEKFIKIFTFKSREKIENIIEKHKENPHQRLLQNELANDITKFIHGEDALKIVQTTTNFIFKKNTDGILDLNKNDFEKVFDTIPKSIISKGILNKSNSIMDFLSLDTNFEIFKSKSDVKRMIAGNGLSINLLKVTPDLQLKDINLIHDNFIIVQKGKKNFHLVKLNS